MSEKVIKAAETASKVKQLEKRIAEQVEVIVLQTATIQTLTEEVTRLREALIEERRTVNEFMSHADD